MVFVDYLNVHSLSYEEHLEHLRYVFMIFRVVNLKLNPSKCEFAKSKLAFWGHVVSCEGTQPNPKKKLSLIFQSPLLY
jgi:hypothetical protein